MTPTDRNSPQADDTATEPTVPNCINDKSVRYSLTPIGSVRREAGFPDLGAITYLSNDLYWAASDSGGRLSKLKISVDATTGRICDFQAGQTLLLKCCNDIEGLAYDPLTGFMLAADESRCVIGGHDLNDGDERFTVPLPPCFSRCRPNESIESLTIREDGLEMWTCNETPLFGDGNPSTKGYSSLVRLTRFTRTDGDTPWQAAGQWAYPIGRMHGDAFHGVQLRGVSDLCVLPDGTLLTLEREFSKKFLPCFRCRIYQVFFSQATDVSSYPTLADDNLSPVRRTRLWAGDSVFDNYEGMCLGERLSDGSRVLLLVSDGDGYASERIFSFKLRIADQPPGKST